MARMILFNRITSASSDYKTKVTDPILINTDLIIHIEEHRYQCQTVDGCNIYMGGCQSPWVYHVDYTLKELQAMLDSLLET